MDAKSYKEFMRREMEAELKKKEFWDKWLRVIGWIFIISCTGIPACGLVGLLIYFFYKMHEAKGGF